MKTLSTSCLYLLVAATQVTLNARRPVWDSGRGTQARSLDARQGPAVDAGTETKK
jgi:hypothetical protein